MGITNNTEHSVVSYLLNKYGCLNLKAEIDGHHIAQQNRGKNYKEKQTQTRLQTNLKLKVPEHTKLRHARDFFIFVAPIYVDHSNYQN